MPKLVQDLYGKSYYLYTNDWYTSEKLFNYLEQNGTTATSGTMKLNWLKVPPSLKRQEMKKGDYAFCQNENLLVVHYKDKKKYISSTQLMKWKQKVLPKEDKISMGQRYH